MKKYILILAVLALAGTAWAAGDSFTDFKGTMTVWSYPGATKSITVDNTAKTLQALYEAGGGTWLGGNFTAHAPIGMFVTCATTDSRWAFGGTTPSTTVGHILPAGSSWHFTGPFYMSTGKANSTSGTDNVTCMMTPEY